MTCHAVAIKGRAVLRHTNVIMKSPKHLLALAVALSLTGNLVAGDPVTSSKGVGMTPPEGKSGFYIGALGGLIWQQDEDVSFSDGSSLVGHFETTWGVSIPIGYRWSNGWQLEFMGGYYDIEPSSQDEHYPAGYFGAGSKAANYHVDVEGSGCWVPLTINTAYRFFRDNPLNFYVGVGAGAIYNHSEITRLGSYDVDLEGSQWDPMAQVFAGLSYAITSNLDLDLGYRYVQQFDRGHDDSKLHVLEAGLVFRF